MFLPNQFLKEIATEKDLPEINLLVNSAYRGDSARKGWTNEADLFDGIRTTEELLAQMVAQPGTAILLHRHEVTQALMGSVYLHKKSDLMYLGMLTVSPDAQGQGVGKVLLADAETYARQAGCRVVEMTVISLRTELIAWYERRGYVLTEERRPFPKEDINFGKPRQELEFVVMQKVLEE
ncbi:GNAT family N-acetyltransferase [Arundinibacter roseus]|uniref:GNAT family N-acetyltransferase n=1 Tax=Arundinibacter roseus TaxID=2070510 RepID=A0A4R4KDS5_9BACT|nr:GNAT family N-acetyltransferase [Arundinibacter roseus]TDB66070.1 GNAT family N-acetyltransferase [Arundinibacter roseus]